MAEQARDDYAANLIKRSYPKTRPWRALADDFRSGALAGMQGQVCVPHAIASIITKRRRQGYAESV